jgi:hypothetical protein
MARVAGGLLCATFLSTVAIGAVVAGAGAGVVSSSLVPATHLRGAVCVVSGNSFIVPSPPSVTTPPTVSPHPSGADVVWLPGLNSKTCKAVLTRGSSHIASDLARDIDHAPVDLNSGGIFCPSDDGTSARLYFRYAHDTTQRINAELSGCSWITAPGDASRSSTAQFRKDMTTLAPSAWRSYIAPQP